MKTDLGVRVAELTTELEQARARIAELEQALGRAHACATVKEDGTCDGCVVSAALKPA